MIRLNEELLTSLGLDFLSAQQMNAILVAIYKELEVRVGLRIAKQWTTAQRDEFAALFDAGDRDGALVCLERHRPDYKTDVREEFEALCVELRASVVEIRSAAIAFQA